MCHKTLKESVYIELCVCKSSSHDQCTFKPNIIQINNHRINILIKVVYIILPFVFLICVETRKKGSSDICRQCSSRSVWSYGYTMNIRHSLKYKLFWDQIVSCLDRRIEMLLRLLSHIRTSFFTSKVSYYMLITTLSWTAFLPAKCCVTLTSYNVFNSRVP